MAASITRRAANSLVKRAVGTQARNASTLKVGTYQIQIQIPRSLDPSPDRRAGHP